MYGNMWLSEDPNAPTIDSSNTVAFPRLAGVPAPGTIITFTPTVTTVSVQELEGGKDEQWRGVCTEISVAKMFRKVQSLW